MQKRLVVCLDGTWQNIVQSAPTNVAHIAQSIAPVGRSKDGAPVPQVTYYGRGVGAPAETGAQTWWNKMTGGGFGEGLEENVLGAYIFLALNYEPTNNDQIYIFGFSRGAYTARSLAGMIGRMGLLRRAQVARAKDVFEEYRQQKTAVSEKLTAILHPGVPIEYLGIFETVGMRGIPSRGGIDVFGHNKKYRFHDLRLRNHVKAARHACAIDERRNAFPVTGWSNLKTLNEKHVADGKALDSFEAPYQQKWFAGQHGDVGGGLPNSVLSDIPLRWIAEGATDCGLAFSDDPHAPYALRCAKDKCAPLSDVTPIGGGFLNALGKDDRVLDLWDRRASNDESDEPIGMPTNECATMQDISLHLHPAARYRVAIASAKYYPKTLKQFLGLPAPSMFERLLGRKPKQDGRTVVTEGLDTGRPADDFADYAAFEAHLRNAPRH